MWYGDPVSNQFLILIFALVLLVAFGPGFIGAIITMVAVRLLQNSGGTLTVKRTGLVAVVAFYVVCIAGILVIYNSGWVEPYSEDEYSFVWYIVCQVVAYGAIVATACYCWTHLWRFP